MMRLRNYAAIALCSARLLQAGGRLESVDITGLTPSPLPGHVIGRVIGIQWDARCLPVRYRMNSTLNPVPNPLGAPFLTLAVATAAIQQSLDQWNNIRTSFISMIVDGTTANAGLVGFNMVNEVSFRTSAGFGAIASSPSVNLIADSTFAHGDDIDGDGDSDVSSAITVAQDVDNDGDIEFPAGFYRAGTILDNDVQFNTKASNGLRFTVADGAVDTVSRSVDLMAVAVHEFGHSIGLAHVLNNQKSATDGNGATMYPFIDTTDPVTELAQRSPDVDDIAWASYLYPEGTAASGPAAIQPGDVPFSAEFGLIQGEVRHGVLNQPLAGASVFALDRRDEAISSSGYSGTTQVSVSPTGGLFLINPAFNILNGNYVLPVPRGQYWVGVEAVDGDPVAASSVNLTAQIGTIFNQQNFNEEFYRGQQEAVLERRPGRGVNIPMQPGRIQSGIDLLTNRTFNINQFGNRNFVGFINVPAGLYYAVRIPVTALNSASVGPDYLIHSGNFETFHLDASVPVLFGEAMLTTGTTNADGSVATLNLANPLRRVAPFLAQDGDFAPFFFDDSHELGKTVREGIAAGTIQNLFLVLRVGTATPFPGVSGQPPLVGLDGGVASNDVPIFGLSYTSADGVTFTRNNVFNFRFSLVLSAPGQN